MTDDPNARRRFLVDKLVDSGLTPEEEAEVHQLQKEAGITSRGIRLTSQQAYRKAGKDFDRAEERRRQQREMDTKKICREFLREEVIEEAMKAAIDLNDRILWDYPESSQESLEKIIEILTRGLE